ncbi:hypothetical protein [Nakamurella endophytica]|uniref:Peptidase S51 n=1 Tax=Nakamurella endophytica TaxID=1748367 RepID=A0A917SX60_9ACTN|nr:hypothetical protein [Nakamurella endophytica]GGM00911.1 hypothetical protein GCM10011594_21200 [Nakamurella endophytica]
MTHPPVGALEPDLPAPSVPGHVSLIGGGWTAAAALQVWGPFLAAAGRDAAVACVVLDEGDGAEQADRWTTVLGRTAPCRPFPVLVPLGGRLDVAALADADALLVCGGLTPAYADALVPARSELRAWLADGPRAYAGFSAGAAVAADRAVVGGWRADGRPVCPEEAGEDLDEVTVVDGLGLVGFAVEVHAAQWGTLPRLEYAVGSGAVGSGVAIDEDTALVWTDGRWIRTGAGDVHRVTGRV